MIEIYKYDHTLVTALAVDDKSFRLKEIMGENSLYVYYTLPTFLEIPLQSYIDFKGERYTLKSPENFTKHHSRNWEYSLKLTTYQDDTAEVKYKYFVGANFNFKLKFPLTMKPQGFVKLLVQNMNLNGNDWVVGEMLDAGEKTLLFDDESCQEALVKIANEFNSEFEFEGKTIHLRKVELVNSPALSLAYGENKGLKTGIGRVNLENTKIINRLYVVGTDRNIDGEKYGNPTLLLPKDETIIYSGITYKTDIHGTYIEREGLTGTRTESSIDLSSVYPKRIGTVSEVVTVSVENNFYDIVDASIPEELNFEDYIIPGETMQLVFQTGDLVGIEFEVNYNHVTKTLKIVPKDEYGIVYPNTVSMPSVGDTYAIFNIQLPDIYIDFASAEMLDEAVEALYDGEQCQYTVTGILDEVFAIKNWATLEAKIKLGQIVSFSDEQFLPIATLLRIVSIKEYVNSLKTPAIELANKVVGSSFAQELASLKANANSSAYSEILSNNSKLKDLFLFKNAPDVANSHIEFKDGITANEVTLLSKLKSPAFNSGLLGEGFMLQKNQFGNWDLELDNLTVRKNMDVFKLTIQEIKSVGGQLLLTPASMTCIAVEELTSVYRCYFNSDGGALVNSFEINDQAICQQFNGSNQKRYWRLVTSIGVDWIDLSKTDRDGLGIPAVGDEIIQLGNRLNSARQNAILISSYGTPKMEQFKGINTFSTADKLVTRISPEGNLFRAVDFSIETADAGSYLRMSGNALDINAKVTFSNNSPALVQVAVQQDVKISQAKTDSENAAKAYADSQDSVKKLEANVYADGKVTDAENRSLIDATNKMNAAKTYADAQDNLLKAQTDAYADGKVSIEETARITQANANLAAAKSYSDAQDNLAKISAQAYADGKVTAEETRSIADATARMNEAKTYAQAQDNLLQTTVQAYADGVATDAENAAIAVAQAKADLAQANAEAHADGIVTAEENARINSVTQALVTAENNAKALDSAIVVGGRNLLFSTNYDYSNWKTLENWTVENGCLKAENTTSGAQSNYYDTTLNKTFIISFVVVRMEGVFRLHNDIFDVVIPSIGKFTKTFTVPLNITTNHVVFYGTGTGTILLKDIQVKVGTNATDWTPAPEDVEADATLKANTAQANAIAQSQVNTNAEILSAKDILALKMGYSNFADMTTKAALGETVISGGMINTELINAVAVMAKFMSTELLLANSVISNNNMNKVKINATSGIPFEVFNSSGQKQLELFEVNGSVQFVYRNKNGDIIWYLGESGMQYSAFTAQAWLNVPLIYAGDDLVFTLSQFGLPSYGTTRPNISTASGVVYKEYVSATNSGTMVQPTLHGKTYASKTTSSTLLANGYYVAYNTSGTTPVQIADVDSNGNPVLNIVPDYDEGISDVKLASTKRYDKWYSITIFSYVSGKKAHSFNFIF